jgi:hypothetical protein
MTCPPEVRTGVIDPAIRLRRPVFLTLPFRDFLIQQELFVAPLNIFL